ncbi:type II toxin-antitoxin system HicB family antitoxin [Candidatus Uhrbacteria bacterium]|nr:type II toxin-antitoxin system HicB family antitoxin [Candidatus Uhrbacteria bacterium]
MRTTKEYSFIVLYEPIPDGGYRVAVPSLSGVVTYGRTFDEARVMARDAIQCTVEALAKEHEHIPNEQSLLQERMVVAV